MPASSSACERIGPVDVDSLIEWISAIQFSGWPQQHRIDEKIRPSMVTDLEWNGFGAKTDGIVNDILKLFPGCYAFQRMLSVVMPGHSIPAHVDGQASYWICRVHVPLTTNDHSLFIVGGAPHLLTLGNAYRVDTTVEHAVANRGDTPRIHFMFDVGKK